MTRTRRSIWRTIISMCLSLILHALESVDLLDLVDQVLRQRLLAEHLEDVVRVGGAVHERLAGADAVALADGEVLALGDEVLLGVADAPA